MRLQRYLDRIGFEGVPRPDFDSLCRLHRGHALAIPYENLDVQFRRRVGREPSSIFEKIITNGRGGWCYEMNGLLGWALEEVGFKITRMAGGVRRDVMGDDAVGNHLVLCVELDRPYLADVGFGDGLIEPVPIAASSVTQGRFGYSLESLGQNWWRFFPEPLSRGPSFDFEQAPADETLLDAKCDWLQTHSESPFVQNAVLQRHRPDGHVTLRGLAFKREGAVDESFEIESADHYIAVLAQEFNLSVPGVAQLWPQMEARHRAVLAEKSAKLAPGA